MNNKWFESSVGDGSLSLTIKGMLTALLPLFVICFKYFGYEIPQADLEALIVLVSGIISSAMILWGLVRKIYYAVKGE